MYVHTTRTLMHTWRQINTGKPLIKQHVCWHKCSVHKTRQHTFLASWCCTAVLSSIAAATQAIKSDIKLVPTLVIFYLCKHKHIDLHVRLRCQTSQSKVNSSMRKLRHNLAIPPKKKPLEQPDDISPIQPKHCSCA